MSPDDGAEKSEGGGDMEELRDVAVTDEEMDVWRLRG